MKLDKQIVIVNDGRIAIFSDIAERLRILLSTRFTDVQVKRRYGKRSGVVYFILNPHHKRCRVKKERKNQSSLYVGWELVNTFSAQEYTKISFGQLDFLGVDSTQKQEILGQRYKTFLLPFAFDMMLPFDSIKDNDVCLIGDATEERQAFIEACHERGFSVLYTHHHTYGKERDRMIARSKIMIDIPRHKKFIFSPNVRTCMGIVNKSLIISSGQYVERTTQAPHVVFTDDINEVLELTAYYLSHEEERLDKVNNAFCQFKQTSVSEIIYNLVKETGC